MGLTMRARMGGGLGAGMRRAVAGSVLPPTAPVNVALPEVTYNTTNAEVGSVFSCSFGTWSGEISGFAFQWTRDGVDIAGATSQTYEAVAADGDATLSCAVIPIGWVSSQVRALGVAVTFPSATLANAATMATGLNSVPTLTTSAITVADAADRKLIALTSLPRNETIAAVECSFDGGSSWLSMLAAYHPGPRADGTDFSNCSIWYYDDPPVGTALVRFTRYNGGAAVGTNTRWFWHACVLQNVAAGGPIATGGDIRTTNGATFTSTTGPVATAKNQKLIGIVHVQETTSNAAMFTSSTDTIANSVFGGGNQNRSALIHRNVTGAGAQNSSVTDPDTNSRFANFALAVFAPVPYAASDPIYFIDTARADDAGAGKTDAAAFKTLSALTALPKSPGFTVNLKGGQVHRHAATGSRAIDVVANGTLALPIEFKRNGAGVTFVSGAIEYNTGWATPGAGEASAYAIANGQKRAMGATCQAYQAPTMDGTPLHPAQWSATGVPSAAGGWDYTQIGSDAVRYAATQQTDAGASLDLTKEVAYRAVGGNVWEVVITHPAIAAHYGSNSPVGAHLIYRSSGNQLTSLPITAYDQANSRVTMLSPAGSSTTKYQPYTDCYWAIRFSPFDLVKANQYAWSADRQTLFAVWPAGTVKGVTRQSIANRLQGGYMRLTNLMLANVMGDTGSVDEDALRASGAGHVYTDVTFRGIRNADNTACIFTSAALTGATMTRVDGYDCQTESLFRFTNATGVTVSGSFARDMGRTLAYTGGTTSGIVFENLDFCEHLAVHGNVTTVYQGARDIEFRKVAAMGCAQGHTSQIANAGAVVANKNVRLKNSIYTGHRDPLGNYSVDTPLIRLDGGDSNGLIDRGIAVLGNGGLFVDNTTEFGFTGNDGLVISRYVLLDASINALPGGTTTEIRDCIILTTASVNGAAATLAANGVTLTRSTFLTLGSGDIAAGTGGAWNGCPTTAMQEHITRVTGFNPGAPVYEAVQIGPDLWGKNRNKGPWIIPAFGASFAMVDLWLSTDEVSGPFQSGRMIGSIAGGRPGSTLSLPGGVSGSSNASFGLDRGVIYCTAELPIGSYNLDVDEANASATNGPTYRTRIPVTVRG